MHRSRAHEDHASDLAKALIEERLTQQALCPGTTLEEHRQAVHDAVCIRNLHGGDDNDRELLKSLRTPWLDQGDRDLDDRHLRLEIFGFYPGPYGDHS